MTGPESSGHAAETAVEDSSGLGSNRTLIITLSSVLSVVGMLLIAGGILLCYRYKQGRLPFFNRGISPIDDDEIETWKINKSMEKEEEAAGAYRHGRYTTSGRSPRHSKQPSTGSTIKTPASVIVYQPGGQQPRQSEDLSPISYTSDPARFSRFGGRVSLDRDLPGTPAQARAPNARAGLTDETIPGDPSFLPSPRRHPSRLSKPPPAKGASPHHRTRSSATSLRSFIYAGSDAELQMPASPRVSNDMYRAHSHHHYYHQPTSSGSGNSPRQSHQQHSRMYSSNSIPPRLSFDDNIIVGGLSPRPLFRDDIGRAIG